MLYHVVEASSSIVSMCITDIGQNEARERKLAESRCQRKLHLQSAPVEALSSRGKVFVFLLANRGHVAAKLTVFEAVRNFDFDVSKGEALQSATL